MKVYEYEPISFTSLWFNDMRKRRLYSSLASNKRCEVCIVGGGISGLTAAYNLSKAGVDVIVLESLHIGSGETGSTTAHLSTALHERYYKILKNQGKKIARNAAKIHAHAINYICNIIKTEKISCDFEYLPGYLFATSASFASLQKECDAAIGSGLSVEMSEISSPAIYKCLKFNYQAQFHPIKYLNSLANIIANRNGQIYEGTHVIDIRQHQSPIRLETIGGYVIDADHVIIATNKPLGDHCFDDDGRIVTRTYVIASTIKKGLLPKALYWDTNEPYHYVRLYQDSSINNHSVDQEIILIGGADHLSHEQPIHSDPFYHLRLWAKLYFPRIGTIRNQWSGCVFDKYNYLNLYKKHTFGRNNIFNIVGGNSNGLTHGTAAGFVVAEEIMG